MNFIPTNGERTPEHDLIGMHGSCNIAAVNLALMSAPHFTLRLLKQKTLRAAPAKVVHLDIPDAANTGWFSLWNCRRRKALWMTQCAVDSFRHYLVIVRHHHVRHDRD